MIVSNIGTANAHVAISPSDSTALLDDNGSPRFRALWIGGAGDLSITDVNDVTIVYPNVPAGLFPFQPKRVNFTGTNATNIVGLKN